jgi:hypothetical protein
VRWYYNGIELVVRVLPVFVFLAIVMSSGGGGAGSCMGVAAGAGSQGAFFVLLENPLVPGGVSTRD